MGVPKFFRWLSERYPCLCEELKEYQIPEFDNFYLDMNGIIHVCSHPNDFDPHFRITEEQIFTNIFHYIEVLFRLIRPKKLFFMAVDGVAPRAKMNQQRGRRFSSAKEAENLEKKALEKGESLPSEKRFDSNCITPGTRFMAKLQEQLKYFVARKMSTDKQWQIPTIILSGHSVPGEGEHKIMDYIRYLRSKPDWDPLTRHCLYGLDADLIILGLCTHEPNFAILREEVRYVKSAKNKRTATPETTNYNLLHLSLLRGYIELEFNTLKKKLPFPFDIEKIIDDWVLMGFLVGNDFIPHLPHWHIHTNALEILYNAYKAVLPTFQGYINENGKLNLDRFEKFLIELSKIDVDTFNDTYADMKYFESKTGRKLFPEMDPEQTDGNPKRKVDEDALNALIESTELEMFDFGDDNDSLDEALEQEGLETLTIDGEENKLMFREFKNHKRMYYLEKMKYPSVSPEVLKKEAEIYVLALQWILFYYYKGCPSWGWYYPHHYSPYVSDLRNFQNLDVKFNLGKPFLPFQQLLAVLPAASREFLPEVYQKLMTSKESPIIDYYPTDFKSDLNGKKMEWEAVVLIPFIEEKRLIDAMQPFNESLTGEEKYRNSHGPMQVYKYSESSLGPYSCPEYFPDVNTNHAGCTEIYPSDVAVPVEKQVTGKHPALVESYNVYRAGFPSLSSLDITGTLEKKGVKVFDYPSRGENMILRIKERKEFSKPVEELFADIMKKDYIFVSYPYLTAAKVKMLTSQTTTVKLSRDGQVLVHKNDQFAQGNWQKRMNLLKETHMNKFGIDVAKSNVIVYANPVQGTRMSYFNQSSAFLEMIWGSSEIAYPIETCALEVHERQEDVQKMKSPYSLKTLFPPGSIAYMIGPLDYGSCVKVKEVDDNSKLVIDLVNTTSPNLDEVRAKIKSSSSMYYPGYVCAQKLGMSPHFFARITSGIIVQSPHTDSDKVNIGLSLKYARANQQMVGFTKKMDNGWLYSDSAIDMVRSYMEKFPDLFMYLSTHLSEEIFFKDKIFPDEEASAKLNEIRTWLKGLEKGELRSIDSDLLEPSVVKVLESVIDEFQEEDISIKTIRLPPHRLYVPRPDLIAAAPDSDAVHLILDRVVFVRECHSIPLGLKGTIIGIEKKSSRSLACEETGWEEAATLYDILFDQEVIGGLALFGSTKKRVYRLTKQVFINISYGERKYGNNFPQYQNQGKDLPKTRNKSQKENKNSEEASWRRMPNKPNATNQNSEKTMQQKQQQFSNGSEFSGSGRPSGSVSNFFNAYRNTVNPYPEDAQLQHGTSGAMPKLNATPNVAVPPNVAAPPSVAVLSNVAAPPNVAVPSNVAAPPPSNDPANLSDMWNLLKSLQTMNTEPCESDSNQIPTLTYMRSNVPLHPQQVQNFPPLPLQQHQLLQKQPFLMQQQLPKRQNKPPPQLLPQPLQQTLKQQQPILRDNLPLSGGNPVRNPQIFPNNNPQVTSPTTPSQMTNPYQFVEQTEALKKMLCIVPTGKLNQNVENNNLDHANRRGNQRKSEIRPLMELETDAIKTKRWSAPVHGSPAMQYPGVNQTSSGSKNCGHIPSCMSYFMNLCNLYEMEEPTVWLTSSEDGVIAFCRLADGFQFSGPIRSNTALAKEAMACSGINVLNERFGAPKDLNAHKPKRRHGPSGYQQAQSAAIQAKPITSNTAKINNFTPPQISAQQNRTYTNSPPDQLADSSYNNSSIPHSYNSANQQSSSTNPNVERQEDGNKKKRNRRKVRIAANFHNPPSPN